MEWALELINTIMKDYFSSVINIGIFIITYVLPFVAFIYAYLWRTTYSLSYQVKTTALIQKNYNNTPCEIKFSCNDRLVNNLTANSIVIWNDGTQTIDKDKFIKEDPIIINYPNEVNVIYYRVLKCNRTYNKGKVNQVENKPNQLMVSFDYLDKNDGVVVEVIHDGDRTPPKILGTIKCVPKGIKSRGIVGAGKIGILGWLKLGIKIIGKHFLWFF